MRKIFTILLLNLFVYSGLAQQVDIVVKTDEGRKAISPLIYGTNQDIGNDEKWTAYRLGGNRLTGYNWENNASNAGKNWSHVNDDYLGKRYNVPAGERNVPGKLLTHFHNRSVERDAYSLVTLQMAGYVARDKKGAVSTSEKAPSNRWDEVVFSKGSEFSLNPDLSDGKVYMDECVNFLVETYGNAKEGGVQAYSLDNEPALWHKTHDRITQNAISCKELVQRSVDFSKVVKNIDPHCEIYGPSLFGFGAYNKFKDAPDWGTEGRGYSWFIDYYLNKMRQAENENGSRLIDVLDLHWYPEAVGEERVINETANTPSDMYARLQAPRTLWDPTYKEDSWVFRSGSDFLPLIPKIQQSIDKYYPGTKLSFTEFFYGGENDMSGGIACADVLGIFGKYGIYSAFQWPMRDELEYLSAAYKMYRNYDGNGGTFGDVSVFCQSSNNEQMSVHSSIQSDDENKVHIILLNKNMKSTTDCKVTISNKEILSSEVWYFYGASSQIKTVNDVLEIADSSFSVTLPKLSAFHVILDTKSFEKQDTTSTGIQFEKGQGKIRIFPNPSTSTLKIANLGNQKVIGLEIFDSYGRLLQSIKNFDQNQSTVDLSKFNIPPGILFLKIHGETHCSVNKIVYKPN